MKKNIRFAPHKTLQKIAHVAYGIILVIYLCNTIACNIDTNKPVPEPYKYKIKINFLPIVGTTPFSLNTPYATGLGESFTATKLKWYTSNWQANNTSVQVPVLQNYFLADAATNTFSTTIQAAAAQINKLSFLLGVDSLRNVSGVQEGALDPLNAMFWTWNSGYIMFKLEGTSPQSTLVNNKLEYHVGGFSGAFNALRTVNFNLPSNQLLTINPSRPSEIDITVNLQKLFSATHNINIATNASCHQPNNFSAKIADNYSQIFTIKTVRNY